MKKLNESQMIIFEQEAGRALMLKNAKEVLVEDAYQELRRILPLYEEMADKKGISRVLLYEFFWNKASDPSKNDGGILRNLYRGFRSKARKFAERNKSSDEIVDAIEQIMQDEATVALFNDLEGYKNMTADELKNDPKYKGIKTRADAVIRRTQYLFLLLGKMDPLLRGRDAAEALADMAGTLGMDPKDLLAQYGKGAQQQQSRGLPPEDQAYVDFRKPGAGGAGRTGGGEGGNIPDSDPVTTPEEEGGDGSPSTEPTTSGDGDGRGRVLTVRSVQRPIINLVQRVAAAQDIDVSVKQAQEIAIMITKNLVNQMRANGVEFKGVTKDLKESFISQIEDILKEESLYAKTGAGKQKLTARDLEDIEGFGQKEFGHKFRMQGALDPADYIRFAKAVVEKYKRMNLGNRDAMEELQKSDEPNTFVDFYDMFMDIVKLRKYYTETRKLASDSERTEIESFKSPINTMYAMYQRNTGFTRDKSKRQYRRKFINMKNKIKGRDKTPKEAEKDLTMSTPTSGQINISQTVAKAIQKGGLSRDDAQKLTPILMKKIQKIIAKELGSDVKYLEEKINRYVSTVLKEIKR